MKSEKTRRLAAIMFTDIVGYTTLMQQDEASAVNIRSRHRKVFETQHRDHNGEIIQYFGDGTLSVFQSGVEAVQCAIEIQTQLQKGPDIVPLRIGLHLGDIVFDGTDIYGDSVNLASRIESMGVAGAILLSGKLNDELNNHPQISTQSLGFFELKNIAKAVEVFGVSNQGIQFPARTQLKGKQKTTNKTIAVLPFVNMSSNEEYEYFSDGMTEEIINALSKIKALRVTSRTSSFHFKNKQIPVSEIGTALNVSTILEGSIRFSGNKMRITAQLIDVQDDYHFWSETFNRSVNDLFEVQDEISLLIADRLREHIGHFDIEDQLVNTPDVPVDIYKRHLKSRYLILKMTKVDLEQGIMISEEIIGQHPSFALAHLNIHLGYHLLGMMGLIPAVEAFTKGQAFLDKAIELDENLPECQLHLSYDAFLQKWDLPATYRYLNKSFEIRPTVEYYQSMASTLIAERKIEAATNYIETALQLDPFSEINHHLRGFIYYVQEKYDEALEWFEKAIQLKPSFIVSRIYKGQALLLLESANEGLAIFQSLPADEPGDLTKLGLVTLGHAALDDKNQLEKGINKLEAALSTDFKSKAVTALQLIYALQNNKDRTLELVEEGLALRLPMMVYLYAEPLFKSLHNDVRFQKVVRQILGKTTTFNTKKRKYKKSLFNQLELNQYKQQLEELIINKKPYLDPTLTLRDLAELMNLSPNHLSQLLNEGFDKNFSDYINTYRLETFKSKVANPDLQHLTILGLAYDSGFNSKTVFNTFFKKAMGKTPKAYWKEVVK